MSHIKVITATLFFLVFASGMYIDAQPAQVIPEFTLFREDRTAFMNKHLDNEKLLFFLFFDVRCEHCRHAIETINKKLPEMKNTRIHLVTLDPPLEVREFLNKHGRNLLGNEMVTLYFDLNHEFITKFKPRKYPSIFLYSAQRKLVLYDDNPEKLPKFFEEIKKRS